MCASVASRPSLFDKNQKRVVITVAMNADDFLQMSGCRALIPELLTGTTVKPCIACFKCLFHGLAVHIGEHQYLVCSVFLNDSRQQFGLLKEFIYKGILLYTIVVHTICPPAQNRIADFKFKSPV